MGFVERTLVLALGCLGLAWGIYSLPRSQAADDFWDIESRLLRFETFSPATLALTLESQATQTLRACDTHSQRAMLLMEIPLAEVALRSGATNEFDQRIQALESRSKQVLSCAPRDAFVWLLIFKLQVLHGLLDKHAFDLLAVSYDDSPNEAWISIRRTMIAMPLVLNAPEPLRQRILAEFRQLIRFGFANDAARSYLATSAPIRWLLDDQIEQLDPAKQRAFSEALHKLRS